jgi:serine/threonine protein kinase
MLLQLSPAARHLLHGMLRPDPADRPQLADLLAHPWFLQVRDYQKEVYEEFATAAP